MLESIPIPEPIPEMTLEPIPELTPGPIPESAPESITRSESAPELELTWIAICPDNGIIIDSRIRISSESELVLELKKEVLEAKSVRESPREWIFYK